MDVERMKKLADEIENPSIPVGFNMSDAYIGPTILVGDQIDPHCGSTCCVGGIACLMFGETGSGIRCGIAAGLLGLEGYEADVLFYGLRPLSPTDTGIWMKTLTEVTREDAVLLIRKMIQMHESGERIG